MISEKRLTQRVLGYWQRLKGDDMLPRFERFQVGALQDVSGYLTAVVLMLEGPQSGFRYQFVGKELAHAFGSDPTGKVAHAGASSPFEKRIIAGVQRCKSDGKPVYDEGQFVNEKHKIVKYRSCYLPFGKDDTMTHIVGGFSWKVFG